MDAKYEEQFTAFVDFLGFSEAHLRSDTAARSEILGLLLSLSALRGEFDVRSTVEGTGKSTVIKPAISTFSDHIVVSYPLQAIDSDLGLGEFGTATSILHHFVQLLTRLTLAALEIGFLVRGGATIGNLYHSNGVVFGEALVDAFRIESTTAVYPRTVLSKQITARPHWMGNQMYIAKDIDGLHYLDYFKMLLLSAARPASDHGIGIAAW